MSMKQKKTIVIVDDHPFLREGLKSIISTDARFEVVADVGNGREALSVIRKLKPNLVLLDISLPDKPGLQLAKEIREQYPDTQIMIVSMHSNRSYIVKAFQSGATGYMAKDSASERLLQGIHAVLKGEYYMDSSVSQQVVEELLQSPRDEPKTEDPAYSTLTLREQEIAVLLAKSFSTKQVADKLCISQKTVENHRSNIYRKLDIHSTLELVLYATKIGLVDLDEWKF